LSSGRRHARHVIQSGSRARLKPERHGLRWLIDHHCGPAQEEANAIRSVHDMQAILIALLVRRIDARKR
jgi:hypothetical protein